MIVDFIACIRFLQKSLWKKKLFKHDGIWTWRGITNGRDIINTRNIHSWANGIRHYNVFIILHISLGNQKHQRQKYNAIFNWYIFNVIYHFTQHILLCIRNRFTCSMEWQYISWRWLWFKHHVRIHILMYFPMVF